MHDLQVRTVAAVQGWMVALRNRTEGATAAEYALLVALIAVAIIIAVKVLGESIKGVFEKTSSTLVTAS